MDILPITISRQVFSRRHNLRDCTFIFSPKYTYTDRERKVELLGVLSPVINTDCFCVLPSKVSVCGSLQTLHFIARQIRANIAVDALGLAAKVVFFEQETSHNTCEMKYIPYAWLEDRRYLLREKLRRSTETPDIHTVWPCEVRFLGCSGR